MSEFEIFSQNQKIIDEKVEFLKKIAKINENVYDFSCGWTHIVLIKKIEYKFEL